MTEDGALRGGSISSLMSVSSAGKIAVLGLQGIRLRLKDQWEAHSNTVHTYFEALLDREMKSGDCYHKIDELSYLVFFRDLSASEAQLKCVAIAEAASRRLFGEDVGAISIRVVVSAVNNALLLQGLDPIAAVQGILSDSGTETIVTQEMEGAENLHTDNCGSKTKTRSPDSSRDLKVTFGPERDHAQSFILDQISFQYRPLWDSIQKVILTYLCQPIPQSSESKSGLAAGGLCLAQDPYDACLLDLRVFREIAERMELLRKEGLRIVAACPVHFSTIAHIRSWTKYARALDIAGAGTVRDIAFLLVGIDMGVPNIRLAQEIPKLSSRTKWVFGAIDYHEGLVARFEHTGVRAIGVELRQSSGSNRNSMAMIEALALESQTAGLASFVLGANSRSIVVGAIASGVRYLEGKTIAAPIMEPRHAFVQDIADLYR